MIPCIDIGPLFDGSVAQRAAVDAHILEAACGVGFLQVAGFGSHLDISVARRETLKRIFGLAPHRLQALWRQKFAPDHPNVYRGWFPLQEGRVTAKEGIDIGPDVVMARATDHHDDPLCEPTPLPLESDLPGWRSAVSQHYAQMANLGQTIMRSLARSLGLGEGYFDPLFQGGISTLRLIRYPALADCVTPRVVGVAHVDSGLVTLLLQDGVSGLQVSAADGEYLDVPVRADAVTVNFGRLLALWSGNCIRATEHRVTGGTQPRFSFPFFYEPRVDALIEPLPGSPASFAPFHYGDFLWQATTRFVEFQGMEGLRPARGNALSAAAAVGA